MRRRATCSGSALVDAHGSTLRCPAPPAYGRPCSDRRTSLSRPEGRGRFLRLAERHPRLRGRAAVQSAGLVRPHGKEVERFEPPGNPSCHAVVARRAEARGSGEGPREARRDLGLRLRAARREPLITSDAHDHSPAPSGRRTDVGSAMPPADPRPRKSVYGRRAAGGRKRWCCIPTQRVNPTDWSPDGKAILFNRWSNEKTKGDVWVLPLAGDRKPYPLLETELHEFDARFSPDGRWIVYTSREGGHDEIYVRPFDCPGERKQVSLGQDAWSAVWVATEERSSIRTARSPS